MFLEEMVYAFLVSVCFRVLKFNLLQMPDILNWFGWCTWDAFYTNVTAEGVKEGLQRSLLILQRISKS